MKKIVFILVFLIPELLLSETMLYRLRVVTRKGKRYELVSTMDKEEYIDYHGGKSVIRKTYEIKKWLEKKKITNEKWTAILKKEKLYPRNYFPLPDMKIR